MTSTRPATVVVAGAGLGGLRAAEQLRAQGFTGEITVVGDEPYPPYNRPPLSKEALLSSGDAVRAAELAASLAFRPRAAAGDVRWRLGRTVVAADLTARSITLDDGEVLGWGALVVATGLRPRRLPQTAPARGRHTIRTAADAAGLRHEVRPGVRVVVVGGGFIGCEAAATLAALGCMVSVVEPLPVPMVRGVGHRVGAALLEHHRAAGVQFVTGTGVSRLIGGRPGHPDADRVRGVVLDDGRTLDADLVVESVGSQATVEWLDGNGLDLTDGVVCDNHLRVEGRADVVAVGDVARFPNPRFDSVPRRVEHWCIPGETARRAAGTLIAHLNGTALPDASFAPLPSFWSDQFGLRLQSFGAPGLADRVEVLEGELGQLPAGVAVGCHRGGEVVGVILINIPPARHPGYRSLLSSAATPAAQLL